MVTLIFKRIGQPVVLGYLLAGFLIGPEVHFLPTVQDRQSIQVWAEIGVIVLLFGLGLEFSFKKLAAVGRSAGFTAIVEIISMMGIGFTLGQLFGWTTIDSIFLGGILSISSTTIIVKAFDELGMKQRRFVSLVFGVLIVEDLVAVLLMVLLSTIAVSNTFEGMQLISSAGRLVFFLTLWFLGGIFLVPWFLRKVRPMMNEETSLVVSLGLCLLMVVLATKSGFSPALGAFTMGSILAETLDGERIEHGLKPVRDLFAAVFFVSVGMLIDLKSLQEHWMAIAIICVVTIFGKIISTSVGALLSGQNLKHSIQSGMSLAQIGEFSFIIATLGLSLKVTSSFLYPLAVAVSCVTTFVTPYLIRSSDYVYSLIDARLPSHLRHALNRSHHEIQTEPGHLAGFQSSLLRLFLNTILVVAIGLAATHWLYPALINHFNDSQLAFYISLGVAIICAIPFLLAILSTPWGWFRNGTDSFKFHSFSQIYNWIEARFLTHLNEKELERQKNHKPKPALAPWDAHLTEIEIHPDSQVVGKTLIELALRENYGVTIALIERGSKQIVAPRRDTVLMAYDVVSALGTDEQLTALSKILLAPSIDALINKNKNYGLNYLQLHPDSPFVSKSIRESGIREATDGLVVGIERDDQRILNPDSLLVLRSEDRLWIVGDKDLIAKL